MSVLPVEEIERNLLLLPITLFTEECSFVLDEGNTTAEIYMEMLHQEVGPTLVNILGDENADAVIFWQQDEAPAHTAHRVRHMLSDISHRHIN
ncbi:uncharacterized protein LOC117173180 isoform X2 [Belonocnema kinseyi]|uniref:uncharacterized protein LOC117173180 isoform X2 n=1 Tax=Belonocnema kinseyi TaxID=2817044 RepID=UPI00143DB8EB|nr:uncharacterized protein LOC117173180 isoform X2 [Belonocnema kinseyi]